MRQVGCKELGAVPQPFLIDLASLQTEDIQQELKQTQSVELSLEQLQEKGTVT